MYTSIDHPGKSRLASSHNLKMYTGFGRGNSLSLQGPLSARKKKRLSAAERSGKKYDGLKGTSLDQPVASIVLLAAQEMATWGGSNKSSNLGEIELPNSAGARAHVVQIKKLMNRLTKEGAPQKLTGTFNQALGPDDWAQLKKVQVSRQRFESRVSVCV